MLFIAASLEPALSAYVEMDGGPCSNCGDPHDDLVTPDGKNVLCQTCWAEWAAAGVIAPAPAGESSYVLPAETLHAAA